MSRFRSVPFCSRLRSVPAPLVRRLSRLRAVPAPLVRRRSTRKRSGVARRRRLVLLPSAVVQVLVWAAEVARRNRSRWGRRPVLRLRCRCRRWLKSKRARADLEVASRLKHELLASVVSCASLQLGTAPSPSDTRPPRRCDLRGIEVAEVFERILRMSSVARACRRLCTRLRCDCACSRRRTSCCGNLGKRILLRYRPRRGQSQLSERPVRWRHRVVVRLCRGESVLRFRRRRRVPIPKARAQPVCTGGLTNRRAWGALAVPDTRTFSKVSKVLWNSTKNSIASGLANISLVATSRVLRRTGPPRGVCTADAVVLVPIRVRQTSAKATAVLR